MSLGIDGCIRFDRSRSFMYIIMYMLWGVRMEAISQTDLGRNLTAALDQVGDDRKPILITRRDAEDAVVMSLDHFNGLMETVHLLKSPANAAHLSRSIQQYRSGETEEHGLLDD